ncbi:YcxB family protein [Blastopirellula retiformator]|uniref:YcxB-like C-terminal domain-containing protein n=1 Tax=Blastopirellula retiformator TaxID=2527970 RepID=A0A5C5V553_9BACT|nr:YcxB family protein [Blastopirellula retiformator]TWT33200.1 hypothetical protein Enr8_30250 [Blastopirellula retiformator]
MTTHPNPFQSPCESGEAIPADAPLVVDGTITSRDAFAAYLLFMLNGKNLAAILIVLAMGTPLLMHGWNLNEALRALIANAEIGICGVVLAILYYFVSPHWRLVRRQLRETSSYQRLTIGETGILCESENSAIQYPWSQISRWRSNRKVLLIPTTTAQLLIVPAHFFESEAAYREAKSRIQRGVQFAASAPSPESLPETTPSQDSSNPEIIIASGENTWGELLLCYWHLLWLPIALFIAIFTAHATAGLLLSVLLLFLVNPQPYIPIAGLLLLVTGMLGVLAALYLHAIHRYYNAHVAGVMRRWKITGESLNESTPIERSRIPWNDITKLTESETRLTFIQHRHAHCLARRFFQNEEDWRQVVEWARQSQL